MARSDLINVANLRKGAILLASVGSNMATAICKTLPKETVRLLAEEMATLGPVDPREQEEVLQKFSETSQHAISIGSADLAESILAQTTDDAADFDATLARLRGLGQNEPEMLWRIIQNEMSQTIALILSQLSAAKAAEILGFMDEEKRGEVAYRTANLGLLSPEALPGLATSIESQVVRLQPNTTEHEDQGSGLEFLLQVFEHLDRSLEKEILAALSDIDESFGEQVQEQLVTFETLFSLNDRSLQTLLRQVDSATLALALKGVAPSYVERVMNNLSGRAVEALTEEINSLGLVRVTEVGAAQKEVTNLARQLDEAGEIALRAEEEEYIE